VRKRIIIIVLVVLAAPLFGLLASAIVGARLATESFAQHAADTVCDSYGQPLISDSDDYCYLRSSNSLLWKSSAVLLVFTVLLPSVYAALAYTLGRSGKWLARCFPWLVRPTMAALAVLLVFHGLLVLYAGYLLAGALSFLPILTLSSLVWSVLLGLGFAWVALLILIEAVRRWSVEPVPIVGIALAREQMPELTERVAILASQLDAKPPERIVVGLEPRAFVTSVPLKLRGQGLLPSAETLYLPTCVLRTFDEQQLNALISHELAHFRAGDLAFTVRFAPSLRGLAHAIDSVSWDVKPKESPGLWSLARLPAGFLIQGIALVLAWAVNRIRRTREFEADRVAARTSSNFSFAAAVVKISLLSLLWKRFRTENAKYLASGRARINLSTDYLKYFAGALSKADRGKLREALLKSRLAHPIDTHPILADRIQALEVESVAIFDRSVDELLVQEQGAVGLESLERAITAIENDWMCIPGTPYVLDREEVSAPGPLAGMSPPTPNDA
jgi:Zn-dependent protease with chaperone function